jgi:hypothetical protein
MRAGGPPIAPRALIGTHTKLFADRALGAAFGRARQTHTQGDLQ